MSKKEIILGIIGGLAITLAAIIFAWSIDQTIMNMIEAIKK